MQIPMPAPQALTRTTRDLTPKVVRELDQSCAPRQHTAPRQYSGLDQPTYKSAVRSTSDVTALEATNTQEERPTSAETARTIVEMMSHGTLATLDKDGCPLGTYTSYVLEETGQPLLRLRADAVHKANLLREPRCSLFIQPQDVPARSLARVTLIGKAEQVDAAATAEARDLHQKVAGGGAGVDAPMDSDEFFRLNVDRCFYVGGMGTACQAEVISKDDFRSAVPDILRASAPTLAAFFNSDRAEDVLRLAAHASDLPYDELCASELLWVDRLGAYVAVSRYNGGQTVHRVRFHRPVHDERDARSMLTMLAQFSWEQDRRYKPPIPEAIAT